MDELDPQRCLLRMSVDSLDWPLLALGTVGAEFEVRSPPELVDRAPATGPPASPAPRVATSPWSSEATVRDRALP